MRITFLLPSTGMCGGVKAVFEFANHLKRMNHDACVVYPLIPLNSGRRGSNIKVFAGRVKGVVLNLLRGNRVDWFDLKAKLIRIPQLKERYIPDADIVVATWWETAYIVEKLGPKKGKKFYLVQHYETWGGPKEEVENSYKLGLKIIVNSTWLKNMLWNELKVKSDALILHAPGREQFYQEEASKNGGALRILMPYRQEKWKGIGNGLKAVEIVRKKYNNIKLVMFGVAGVNIPSGTEFYERPDNNKLRNIYNSCDIFVYPSTFEGFGMPPMEAMACGIPTVLTNVGAVPDYAIAGQTALVSEPGDIEGMAKNIIYLIEHDAERKKIAENGYNHIKQFTWENSAEQLEHFFQTTLSDNHG